MGPSVDVEANAVEVLLANVRHGGGTPADRVERLAASEPLKLIPAVLVGRSSVEERDGVDVGKEHHLKSGHTAEVESYKALYPNVLLVWRR